MKLINIYNDVKSISVNENEGLICKSNSVFFINENLKELNSIESIKAFYSCGFLKSGFCIQEENSNEFWFISKQGEITIHDDVVLMHNRCYRDSFFVYSKDGIIEYNEKLEKQNIYKIGRIPKFFLDNGFIRIGKSVQLFNYENELKWECVFNELLRGQEPYIQGEPQIIYNSLYIPLLDRQDNSFMQMVILDVKSGKKLNQINGFMPSTKEDHGNLYMFDLRRIVQYNTAAGTLKELKFDDEFKDISRRVGANAYFNAPYCVKDNKAYFSTVDNRSSACFGVVDLFTGKLEYFQDMNESPEEFKRSVRDIKVSEKHVFVHCSDNTLYVYEK